LSQELYEQPRQKFSQGDIFEVAPHIFLDPPLLALTPAENGSQKSEKEPFSTFDDSKGQDIVARCKRTTAILITPDCEIDKETLHYWHICPVVPLSKLSGSAQGHVKRNRFYSRYFLPRSGNVISDSFVDFNQLSTIAPDFLKAAKRIVSLSDLGRQGLYVQFIRWLTRWELKELSCPNCQSKYDVSTSLPVRAAD
jgi:hypothetical protein